MSTTPQDPDTAPTDSERAAVIRELYVYRDMTEGFLMTDLTPEHLQTAITALTLARQKMLKHGIPVLPQRWYG